MRTITRRVILGGVSTGLMLPQSSRAQSQFYGRIAFVQDGNIMQWTPNGVSDLKRDGNAMSPSWQSGTDMLMYIRDGGSFSNLISLDTTSGRTRRLTDSESPHQKGSQEYVFDCDWINDVFWSESNIVVFSSNAEPSDGSLTLWVLDYAREQMYPAVTDYAEPGHIEKATTDAIARYAVYTLIGEDMRSSSVGLRDLQTGATSTVMDSNAYDGAISPNGHWVVGCIRDERGVSDLWLWNDKTGETTQLTFGEQANNPTWDPFGEAIAYLAYVDGGFSLRAFYVDFTASIPQINGDPVVLIPKANLDANSRPSWNTDR